MDQVIAISSGVELESLQNLRSDLQELLDLTNETLHEQTGGEISKNRDPDDNADPLASEMSLFMREIQEIDSVMSSTAESPHEEPDEDDLNAFNTMKVSKCCDFINLCLIFQLFSTEKIRVDDWYKSIGTTQTCVGLRWLSQCNDLWSR